MKERPEKSRSSAQKPGKQGRWLRMMGIGNKRVITALLSAALSGLPACDDPDAAAGAVGDVGSNDDGSKTDNLNQNSNQYTETDIDQRSVVALAFPRGTRYDLYVYEQLNNTRPCWAENGSNPTVIDPLLLQFNFTGICGRAVDTNGYSIRYDGQDLGTSYRLKISGSGSELLLQGLPSSTSGPDLTIARSGGMASGFLKFNLEPGCKISKRTYGSQVLGHYYFSNSGGSPAPENEAADADADSGTDWW